MSEHTPTPWQVWTNTMEIYGGDGRPVAQYVIAGRSVPIAHANAEFIVRACNSFNALVVAADLAENTLTLAHQDGASICYDAPPSKERCGECYGCAVQTSLDLLRAALQLARPELEAQS